YARDGALDRTRGLELRLDLRDQLEAILEIARELRERLLARAHELELPLDQRCRGLDDPHAILVARVVLPLVAQGSPRVFRLCEIDDRLERETQQVAQPEHLLEMRDVGLAVEPMGALAALAPAQEAELLVVADRARGDSEALGDLADAETALVRGGAHADLPAAARTGWVLFPVIGLTC